MYNIPHYEHLKNPYLIRQQVFEKTRGRVA